MRKGSLLAFILLAGFTIIAFGLDTLDGYKYYSSPWRGDYYELYSWAPGATLAFALAIFYIFGVWAIYNIAKYHGHNAVR